MTTFQPVSVGLGLSDYSTDATTPTTPRAPAPPPIKAVSTRPSEDTVQSAPNTPTNANFAGVSGQRPLPTSPFKRSFSPPPPTSTEARPEMPDRADSNPSAASVDSQDIEMGVSDGEGGGSDAESVDADGRPSKKKKGQKFFCTEFPPCKLSFTRSEHLARHIRKHTGERPFQCHCSRRFSRLDNLRQHAQTVHVNEDIPGDSLAAAGTRFNRQIRTDRMTGGRNPGNRSRHSIGSAPGGHARGHGRNLSASSIGSTASTISRDDARRRPPPLIMAGDHAGPMRLSLEILRSGASTPPGQNNFLRDESEGISTPTSTTYSTGQNSPGGYGSSIGSPGSAISRGGGFWDNRTHARRLSVPSGTAPYQSPQINSYGSPYLSPLASSNASHFSNLSSSFGSPAMNGSMTLQPGAVSAAEEWRRRTWHPSSHTYTNYSRPATSGLNYHQTPGNAPRPSIVQQVTTPTPPRLPGIETFDQMPRRPATPPGAGPPPLRVDQGGRPPVYPGPSVPSNTGPNDRRGHASWDMSLHKNLTKLDIASAEQGPMNKPSAFPPQREPPGQQVQGGPHVTVTQEVSHRPMDGVNYSSPTPTRAKRQGWYAGPPFFQPPSNPQHGTSPGESSSSEGLPTTPSATSSEHHPAIMHSSGYIEPGQRRPSPGPAYRYHTSTSHATSWPLPAEPNEMTHNTHKDTEMSGLEVLVAVATSQENATATPNA